MSEPWRIEDTVHTSGQAGRFTPGSKEAEFSVGAGPTAHAHEPTAGPAAFDPRKRAGFICEAPTGDDIESFLKFGHRRPQKETGVIGGEVSDGEVT